MKKIKFWWIWRIKHIGWKFLKKKRKQGCFFKIELIIVQNSSFKHFIYSKLPISLNVEPIRLLISILSYLNKNRSKIKQQSQIIWIKQGKLGYLSQKFRDPQLFGTAKFKKICSKLENDTIHDLISISTNWLIKKPVEFIIPPPLKWVGTKRQLVEDSV